jgi:hypothetical protein
MLSDDELIELENKAARDVGSRRALTIEYGRAIIAAHTAKLLAGVMVEFPCHPEPHTYRWSRLEEEVIKQYAAAAALNARKEALEEAKVVWLDVAEITKASGSWALDAHNCASAIEALKGKV